MKEEEAIAPDLGWIRAQYGVQDTGAHTLHNTTKSSKQSSHESVNRFWWMVGSLIMGRRNEGE